MKLERSVQTYPGFLEEAAPSLILVQPRLGGSRSFINLKELQDCLNLGAYPKTPILAGATLQRRACQNWGFRVAF
jgi:hypothetical protein